MLSAGGRVQSDTLCAGCGARNNPTARVCEWCGRPFLLRDQNRQGRLLWAIGALLGLVFVIGATVLVTANASRFLDRPTAVATVVPTAAPVELLPASPPDAVDPSEA